MPRQLPTRRARFLCGRRTFPRMWTCQCLPCTSRPRESRPSSGALELIRSELQASLQRLSAPLVPRVRRENFMRTSTCMGRSTDEQIHYTSTWKQLHSTKNTQLRSTTQKRSFISGNCYYDSVRGHGVPQTQLVHSVTHSLKACGQLFLSRSLDLRREGAALGYFLRTWSCRRGRQLSSLASLARPLNV